MGQASCLERGRRFIDEFNEDAQHFAIKASCVTSSGLGLDDYLNVVRMYHAVMTTEGRTVELMSEGIFYDPQVDDDVVIEATMSTFGLDEATTVARLKKAGLIDPNTEAS